MEMLEQYIVDIVTDRPNMIITAVDIVTDRPNMIITAICIQVNTKCATIGNIITKTRVQFFNENLFVREDHFLLSCMIN